MHHRWDEPEELIDRLHRHRRRSKKRKKELTPEERRLREAKRRANAKLGFISHLIAYASVLVLVLGTAGLRAAFVLALAWGIGLAFHWFGAVIAPDLRERLVAREVDREVAVGVSRERQQIEGKHARSLEQLSAAVAHEIRNPVTAAKSLVQQMGEDPASGQNVGYAKVAIEELDRVERSISHLLRYAREEEIQVLDVHLHDVVESALETFRDRVDRRDVLVDLELDTPGAMRGDPEKLRRIVINLIGNALDAMDEAGTPDPTLDVALGENLAGTEVWLRVRDNGPGIDEATIQKIFSPFYTSKTDGTGLGLAISKKIVEAHGGSIEVDSEAGRGTGFLVTFPKQSGAAAS
jgi:two-component system sensor histidine kinase HydH